MEMRSCVLLATFLSAACGGQGSRATADGAPIVSCPSDPPGAGDSCTLSSLTACSYGDACDALTFECTGGTWRDVSGDSSGTCPSEAPTNDSVCSRCADYTCSYNPGCVSGDGPSGTATCTGGRWHVMDILCSGDGGVDGSGDS